MTDTARSPDEIQITAIVGRMFDAISWSPGEAPDFDRFAEAVMPEATLVPSARPTSATDIASFIARMRQLHADGTMSVFSERPLKTAVQVFGNIAVAIGGYEMQVDGGAPSRGANAFLFVRTEAGWQIAGMAWDNERPGAELDASLS